MWNVVESRLVGAVRHPSNGLNLRETLYQTPNFCFLDWQSTLDSLKAPTPTSRPYWPGFTRRCGYGGRGRWNRPGSNKRAQKRKGVCMNQTDKADAYKAKVIYNRQWRALHKTNGKKNLSGIRNASSRRSKLKWQIGNREKARAHVQVCRAVKRGVLIRSPCVICGDVVVHAHHHHGYRDALDVMWLCPSHHREIHR